MDLSFIADLLDDFATFAGAIEDFLTLPVDLLVNLSSLETTGEADVVTTSDNFAALSS